MADETPQDEPSFVTDQAAGADPEKPAVAPDDAAPDEAAPQDRAPNAFEVEDAITKTALDGPE